MEMSKTVKQWLEELPDGYRERALRQCTGFGEYTPETICESMAEAIERFTPWYATTEGGAFWYYVYDHYRHLRSPLPQLPKPTLRERIEKRIAQVIEEEGLEEEDFGKTMYENGIINALKWVLDNIDLTEEDTI